MKKLMSILLICSFLTACDQPGKDDTSPAPTPAPSKPVTPGSGFTAQERTVAYKLSIAYAKWKEETQCDWAASDPKAYELAQAFVLGAHAGQNGFDRMDLLVIVLEKFLTLQDSSATSKEMLLLARSLIEKEESK